MLGKILKGKLKIFVNKISDREALKKFGKK
jgi:hypothetical protein